MGKTDTFDILLILTAGGATALDRVSGTQTTGDIASALNAVGPRKGVRVLVASDAVFSQTVRLPAAQTASLSKTEIESALFYEVEPFCGIARDNAAIGVERLADGEWQVAVASNAELSSLRTRIQGNGFRLAGVAAIPRDTDAGDPTAVLAALLPADGPSAIILKPPRGGISSKALATGSAMVTALLMLICLGDWFRLSWQERHLRPALAEAEPIAAANARIMGEIKADEDRVRAIAEARARREGAMEELASRRDRWLALLATLASDSGDRVVIRSIVADDRQSGGNNAPLAALVDGLAANPAAAADAMSRLSSALSARGWTVEPGTVAERSGGAASFSFHVSPSSRRER